MATSYYQHRYYHDEDDENTPLIPVLSSSPSMAFSLVGRKRSPITNTTLIAVSITIVANIIAQYLEINYAHHVTSTPSAPDHPNVPAVVPVRQAYDPWRVLQFGTWALISTPPLFKWQQFLERTFPAYFPEEKVLKVDADDEGAAYTTHKKRNWKNTGTKVLLEQVCAAPINCTIFLFTIKALAGGSITQCIANIHDKFWQVKLAGYRVWPVVSIFNMTFVPVDRRIIVTNIIGLLWQIFLALRV